jgi:hypothetical protein
MTRPWAALLRRTFGFDLESCPRCIQGTLAVIADITDGKVVKQILEHLSLPTELPTPLPARRPSSFEELWSDEGGLEERGGRGLVGLALQGGLTR